MATAGIVAEYNPFHRGHAWHIARTRRTLGADTAVICVMSGHWVQRGECALTDKWSRAALALSGGELAALGLEGPAIGAAQRRLAAHILSHPEDNTPARLLALAGGAERAVGAAIFAWTGKNAVLPA